MSTLTYKEIQKIRRGVRKCAKLLDKQCPKLFPNADKPWYRTISLAEMKFSDCTQCVFGQLFTSMNEGCRKLNIEDVDDGPYKYGVAESDYAHDLFDEGEEDRLSDEHEKMVEFWFEEILTRRRATA